MVLDIAILVAVVVEKREKRGRIASAIVAAIGQFCLKFETIVRISNEIQTKR